jgi:integrase
MTMIGTKNGHAARKWRHRDGSIEFPGSHESPRQHRRKLAAAKRLVFPHGARDGRLDGIGPAHEARHPAGGSLRAQRGRSDLDGAQTAARLMTVYGCGLRISEATQLKTSDIDRPPYAQAHDGL